MMLVDQIGNATGCHIDKPKYVISSNDLGFPSLLNEVQRFDEQQHDY